MKKGNDGVNLFTMIEFLITISIITILAGMLLPVLNKVRGKAYTISCVSNQKQFSYACAMYAGDYADQLPIARYTLIPTTADLRPVDAPIGFSLLSMGRYIPVPSPEKVMSGTNRSKLLRCPVVTNGWLTSFVRGDLLYVRDTTSNGNSNWRGFGMPYSQVGNKVIGWCLSGNQDLGMGLHELGTTVFRTDGGASYVKMSVYRFKSGGIMDRAEAITK
jgi:hypothetical protein